MVDYNLANQAGSAFRAELNTILAALAASNRGGIAPTTTFAGQLWVDSSGANDIVKIRNAANDAWVTIGTLGSGGFESAGGVTFASQAEAETGTNTTRAMNPLRTTQFLNARISGNGDFDINPSLLASRATIKTLVDSLVAEAGGLVFLASRDASNSAALAFTEFDGGEYDGYLFKCSNLVPATDTVQFRCRTSSNGGSSYDSAGSHYTYTMQTKLIFGSESYLESGGASSILLSGSNIGSDTGEDGISGELKVYGPHLAKSTILRGEFAGFNAVGNLFRSDMHGARLAAAAVDAIQFTFDSGDIESGTISMYGYRNA